MKIIYKITSNENYLRFLQDMEKLEIWWGSGNKATHNPHYFKTHSLNSTLFVIVRNNLMSWDSYPNSGYILYQPENYKKPSIFKEVK